MSLTRRSQGSLQSTDWTKTDEALRQAVMKNELSKVRNLVQKKKTNPWKISPADGTSTVHTAAGRSSLDVLETLLSFIGRDVDEKDQHGKTPLHYAAMNGKDHNVNRLLKSRANPGEVDLDGKSSLHLACYSGNMDCIRQLITETELVQAKDNRGQTALIHAASKGRASVCRLLLESGADVNASDVTNRNALMTAASAGHYAVCDYLLNLGADASAKDIRGNTVLSYAQGDGSGNVTRLVLNKMAGDQDYQTTHEVNIDRVIDGRRREQELNHQQPKHNGIAVHQHTTRRHGDTNALSEDQSDSISVTSRSPTPVIRQQQYRPVAMETINDNVNWDSLCRELALCRKICFGSQRDTDMPETLGGVGSIDQARVLSDVEEVLRRLRAEITRQNEVDRERDAVVNEYMTLRDSMMNAVQLNDAEDSKTDLVDIFTYVMSEYERLSTENNELKATIETRNSQIVQQNSEHQRLSKENNELNVYVQNSGSQIAQQNREFERLSEENNELKNEMKNFNAQINQLNREHERFLAENNELKDIIKNSNSHIIQKNRELEQLSAENNELKERMEYSKLQTVQQNRTFSDEIERLQGEIHRAQSVCRCKADSETGEMRTVVAATGLTATVKNIGVKGLPSDARLSDLIRQHLLILRQSYVRQIDEYREKNGILVDHKAKSRHESEEPLGVVSVDRGQHQPQKISVTATKSSPGQELNNKQHHDVVNAEVKLDTELSTRADEGHSRFISPGHHRDIPGKTNSNSPGHSPMAACGQVSHSAPGGGTYLVNGRPFGTSDQLDKDQYRTNQDIAIDCQKCSTRPRTDGRLRQSDRAADRKTANGLQRHVTDAPFPVSDRGSSDSDEFGYASDRNRLRVMETMENLADLDSDGLELDLAGHEHSRRSKLQGLNSSRVGEVRADDHRSRNDGSSPQRSAERQADNRRHGHPRTQRQDSNSDNMSKRNEKKKSRLIGMQEIETTETSHRRQRRRISSESTRGGRREDIDVRDTNNNKVERYYDHENEPRRRGNTRSDREDVDEVGEELEQPRREESLGSNSDDERHLSTNGTGTYTFLSEEEHNSQWTIKFKGLPQLVLDDGGERRLPNDVDLSPTTRSRRSHSSGSTAGSSESQSSIEYHRTPRVRRVTSSDSASDHGLNTTKTPSQAAAWSSRSVGRRSSRRSDGGRTPRTHATHARKTNEVRRRDEDQGEVEMAVDDLKTRIKNLEQSIGVNRNGGLVESQHRQPLNRMTGGVEVIPTLAMKTSEEELNLTIRKLQKQIDDLQRHLAEQEKQFGNVIATYRTHLLAAVQGCLDNDVRDALLEMVLL